MNEAHHEPTAVYREIEPMMSQLEAGPSSVGRGKPDTDPGTGPDPPPGAKPDTAHDFKLERYYTKSGKFARSCSTDCVDWAR